MSASSEWRQCPDQVRNHRSDWPPRRRHILKAGLALPVAGLLPACGGALAAPFTPGAPQVAQASGGNTGSAEALYRRMESTVAEPIAGTVAEMEALVLDATNETRRKQGVRPLQPDTVLAQAARFHSRDMSGRDFFAHDSPDGVTARQRIGVWHRWMIGQIGENIWESRLRTRDMRAMARLALTHWMESPSHRDNLLQADFTHVGIGAARHDNTWRLTQSLAAVKSYLADPVPLTVRRGEAIDLSVDERGGSIAPSYYGLAKPGEEELIFGPYPPAESRIVAETGTYVMWYYIKDRDYFRIYDGPWLTVAA